MVMVVVMPVAAAVVVAERTVIVAALIHRVVVGLILLVDRLPDNALALATLVSRQEHGSVTTGDVVGAAVVDQRTGAVLLVPLWDLVGLASHLSLGGNPAEKHYDRSQQVPHHACPLFVCEVSM